MNTASSMEIAATAKEDILLRDDMVTKKNEEFMSERLVASTAEKSTWDLDEQNETEDIQYVSEEDKLQSQ